MTGVSVRREADHGTDPADGGGFLRFAGMMLIVSGVVAAAGVVFLVAMFASFGLGARDSALTFGRINDVLILVGYLLATPAVLAIRSVLRPFAGGAGDALATVGLAAIVATVVLQLLLVAGTLTFEQQIGPVSIALLVLGGWFVTVGWLGSQNGVLPAGTRMGLLAAVYVGYPIWAVWLGRRLVTRATTTVHNRADAG